MKLKKYKKIFRMHAWSCILSFVAAALAADSGYKWTATALACLSALELLLAIGTAAKSLKDPEANGDA